MVRQRYQVFDAVVPQARSQSQMTDNPMHLQSHGVYENQKPYMMSAPPHPMDPRGQMMPGSGVPATYPPMYPPHQQGMEMQGQYANPYTYQPYDVRSGPSGQSAPLSASTSRQNRRAQQAARNNQKAIASQKRKITTPSLPSDDEESDSDGEVPDGQNPSAADIARNKYNHVEDEKERKRLKRLLRNRVSAQQARERKKAYMGNLEDRLRNLESRNEELEERANTLEKENSMLRQLLKTQTSKNGL
mmetsp:Transcript_9400/g.19435  ORF Transcript_9400/g.19435 Transcript_9400/m.19435 type:complete len:246 (-) Transcript_9400:297-1034(-)|eukprot:CAMPEP_0118932982 /NCGR_PEP_ID=MMETSP1169-20130426/10856_1 /TAXON_ID=36882 /ORGANISM="Pyramimonas obovata, Strain CCMP722" /LENGTH=245 /DNA_ID=CAMNT_0006875691 /DNA_START=166 /DNA_END=903 /DNA_ORIENTATION=-